MYKASNTFSGIYLTPYKYSLLLFTLPVKFSDSLVHIYVRRREALFSLQFGPVCFFWFQGEAWLWGRWGVIQRRRWMMMSLRSSLGGWTPQGDMSLITPFVSLFFFFFPFALVLLAIVVWFGGLSWGYVGYFKDRIGVCFEKGWTDVIISLLIQWVALSFDSGAMEWSGLEFVFN